MAEKCPHCELKISLGDGVECPKCKTRYHKWCWRDLGKCLECGFVNDPDKVQARQEAERQRQEAERQRQDVSTADCNFVQEKTTNKGNIISGIVFIIFGIIMFCLDSGNSGGGYITFGGDFYTEIYNEVTKIVFNLQDVITILKFGFGFLFIGLGVSKITKNK